MAIIKGGKINRPHVGKCPVCGVHTNESCRSWCNAIDPYANPKLKRQEEMTDKANSIPPPRKVRPSVLPKRPPSKPDKGRDPNGNRK